MRNFSGFNRRQNETKRLQMIDDTNTKTREENETKPPHGDDNFRMYKRPGAVVYLAPKLAPLAIVRTQILRQSRKINSFRER